MPAYGAGVRRGAWYQLLVAMLGILSPCQSVRGLQRFATRHHRVLTVALGIELRSPPSDSGFRYFFKQVDATTSAQRFVIGRLIRFPLAQAILSNW